MTMIKCNHNRHYSSIFLLSLCIGLLCNTQGTVEAATKTAPQQDTPTTTMSLPRRERHLDFMDAATLAYYLGLDPDTGERAPQGASDATHNVAVMFYAQWDRNSHQLAPIWDQIGQLTKAGSKTAGLLLGLFDCELDQQHLMLCHAAGVTHYPTLMFMSPSRTFPHKPGFKHKALPHTTQFQGIWQYDKSILDWLRTMQRLAGWSKFWSGKNKNNKKGNGGWWQAANYDPLTADALPVGVPTTTSGAVGTTSALGSSSTSSTATGEGSAPQMAAALKEAQAEKKQYEELVLRSSVLLDATLLPAESEDAMTDVFAYLAAHNGWDATDTELQIIKTCAMEISLDYCTRVTTHKTTDLVQARTGQGATLEELEAELKTMIATAEPYCNSIDACIQDDFATPVCRAPVCPFENKAACNYLTACFDVVVQGDYAKAMGLTLPAKAV